MREFVTFTITYLFWIALAVALSLTTTSAIAFTGYAVAQWTTPYFGAAQGNHFGEIAMWVTAGLSFLGFIMSFLTVRVEITERSASAPNRRPATPTTGSGQRSASSPPLPGSTRPDPRKEHNP